MDMDMVIPLNLNLNKKNVKPSTDVNNSIVTTNQSPSPTKPILGRDQAKKRLLAFAQQWNKTKENSNATKSLPKTQDQHRILKYTYVVEGEDGREISFPANIIQYTNTEPSISFCENPHYVSGVYQGRKEIMDEADDEIRQAMHFIMNSTTPYYENRKYPGRYRKWYADKNTFIDKPPDNSEQPTCSPNWESDSDEECREDYNEFGTDLLPKTVPALLCTNVVSKVKINKVELPFYEDDDFLNTIMSSVSKHSRSSTKEETTNLEQQQEKQQDIQEEYSAFMSSLDSSRQQIEENSEVKPNESSTSDDWKMDDTKSVNDIQHADETRKRPASPDWDQQWRSSSYRRYNDRSRRSSSSSPRRGRAPRTPDEDDARDDDESYYNGQQSNQMDGTEEVSSSIIDAKRISLDERLELELGIKMEHEQQTAATMLSPQSYDQFSLETSPVKRKRGFGPKAAPLGPLIFSCPKALPATPLIPPHLQNLLYQPLIVRNVTAKAEDDEAKKTKEKEDEEKQPDTESEEPEKDLQKDWDKELKNLEAVAANLEAADETVLEALEEKLLLFETNNILPSGGESPAAPEIKEEKSEIVEKPKRSKPEPIDLKEAGKGILVMPRVSLLDETSSQLKKNVVFADNVRPGYGTSSEDEEEAVRSPPPPPVPQQVAPTESSPKKKFKKHKREKFIGDDFDPVFDLLPPPPPPPGSPPPHLPQGRSPTPTPVPSSTETADSFVAAIESVAC